MSCRNLELVHSTINRSLHIKDYTAEGHLEWMEDGDYALCRKCLAFEYQNPPQQDATEEQRRNLRNYLWVNEMFQLKPLVGGDSTYFEKKTWTWGRERIDALKGKARTSSIDGMWVVDSVQEARRR